MYRCHMQLKCLGKMQQSQHVHTSKHMWAAVSRYHHHVPVGTKGQAAITHKCTDRSSKPAAHALQQS
jgi:hypothetical protein